MQVLVANIEAFLAIFIFSFVPVAIKFTAANPYSIGIFRLALAATFVGIWWHKKIDFKSYFKLQSWRLYLIGIIFFFHWITYFWAIKIGGAQACILGMSTYGVQLIFYGSIFLDYKMRPKNYVALILVLLGLYFVLPDFKHESNFSIGVLLGLISAAFYSIMPILHQRSNAYFKHEQRIFSQFLFALMMFLFFIEKTDWNLVSRDWWALLFLAIFGTLIAHSLWAKASSSLPTYVSGILYYLITPMALVLSYLILGETLSRVQITGSALILSGAVFNIWSTKNGKT